MPLPDPARREHLHTRTIDCQGFAREDGMWDIEAHLQDTKTYASPNTSRGTIHPGEPLHDIRLRLTLDEKMQIHRVEAAIDSGPFSICGDIASDFTKLEGLQIGPGWMRQVRGHVDGMHGCTHLVELLQTLATVAFQTVPSPNRSGRTPALSDASRTKPTLIDSCHALRSDGPVVKREWPKFYTGGREV